MQLKYCIRDERHLQRFLPKARTLSIDNKLADIKIYEISESSCTPIFYQKKRIYRLL